IRRSSYTTDTVCSSDGGHDIKNRQGEIEVEQTGGTAREIPRATAPGDAKTIATSRNPAFMPIPHCIPLPPALESAPVATLRSAGSQGNTRCRVPHEAQSP